MRKIIIDTDCGSDDAVAILMALKSDLVDVIALTTVCGNVPLDLATKNALMTIEVSNGQHPPVYVGAAKPLLRNLVTAVNVHGEDGMGDCNLIHPTIKAEEKHAVDAILDLVKENPNEIEIIAIGPATNISMAIHKDPETMKNVKHIYTMGTGGFGLGNTTPVAEFNVYVDAEAYKVMVDFEVPVTIIGFDVCLGESAWNRNDMNTLKESGKAEAHFAVDCNRCLLAYNLERESKHIVDLPDAVAMAVMLWSDEVAELKKCHAHVCTNQDDTYGQVIMYTDYKYAIDMPKEKLIPNSSVVKSFNATLYKERLNQLLLK